MVNAASTLQTAFTGMLRTPVAGSRPTSIYKVKALPSPPHSIYLSSPDLPAELPGSILQDNHGFPPRAVADELVFVRPVSQNVRRSTLPLNRDIDYEDNFSTLIALFPDPLSHSKSVPDLGQQFREMRSVRSSTALSSISVSKPSPLRTQHKTPPLSERSSRSSSRAEVVEPLTLADVKLLTCSTSTAGGHHDDSARVRIVTNQTSQPASLSPEAPVWDGNAEDCESRRSEVSTVCFQDVMCLFVKQDTMHNETVSELSSFLSFSLIRRIVPEINLHVQFVHGHGSHLIGIIIVVWHRETLSVE
jgi:hypothetical protein